MSGGKSRAKTIDKETTRNRQGLRDYDRLPQRPRDANRHRRDRIDTDAPPVRHEGGPYRDEYRGDRRRHRRRRDDHPGREWDRDDEREAARAGEEFREAARREELLDAAREEGLREAAAAAKGLAKSTRASIRSRSN